ncbi:MAG UNVERIFIED_CONTAM: FAD-dependent oxidoreductase [Planctomycetaceae bacterium]
MHGRSPQSAWQTDGPDCSTADYLRHTIGFSEDIIRRFFRPWFAGVFLEPDLATSSRMFRFLFGTFAAGDAALPADGMESIPRQLATSLPAANLRLNCKVRSVDKQSVTLNSGEILNASRSGARGGRTGCRAAHRRTTQIFRILRHHLLQLCRRQSPILGTSAGT